MESALLLYGDTERSAALRHELPIVVPDPFLLGVIDGRHHVMVNSLERERVAKALPDAELHDVRDLGFYELLGGELSRDAVSLELTSRAAAAMGVSEALVDPDFPVGIADRLRADGIVLTPDAEAFASRRRVKSPAELEGIRRAQRAAEAGMAAAAATIAAAEPDGDSLRLADGPLTAETVRAAIREACAAAGAPAPPGIIVASVWQGYGHEPGSGPLPAGLPIQVDLWPRDEASGCWADMTRTFLVGEVPDGVRRQEQLVREAFEGVREATRPGISGRELHAIACDVFEARRAFARSAPVRVTTPTRAFSSASATASGWRFTRSRASASSGARRSSPVTSSRSSPGSGNATSAACGSRTCCWSPRTGAETLTEYPYELAPVPDRARIVIRPVPDRETNMVSWTMSNRPTSSIPSPAARAGPRSQSRRSSPRGNAWVRATCSTAASATAACPSSGWRPTSASAARSRSRCCPTS